MGKRKPLLTKQEIDSIYDSGDFERLRQYNETLAKRANERLSSLEKAGMDNTGAYERAVDWIQNESDTSSGNRFSRSKKMDIDEVYNQIIQESDFLRRQTSTVAGEKKRREHIFNSMMDSDVLDIQLDENDPEAYKNNKEKFMKFLDEDVFNELVKTFRATDIINLGADAIQNGQNPQDLQDAYSNYLQSDIDDTDILTIFETWAGAGLHERNRS